MRKFATVYIFVIVFVLLNKISSAQITLPPSGDNQKSSVTQYMGLVGVTINYSSPDVHGLNGEDRTGHIWGELVPYGFASLGFGISSEANPSPWRAGANENTTFTFSHNVLIEGNKLAAGTYGFFIAAAEGDKEWIAIFSKKSTAWGSFSYEQKDDALRVNVKPQTSEYHEWLTYEFIDRKPDACVVALKWENKSIPIKIAVENINEVYFQQLSKELEDSPGFDYNNYANAALFLAQNKIHLDKALLWADEAMTGGTYAFTARKDFTTMSAKATVLDSTGRHEEAKTLMLEAMNDASAPMLAVHFYARGLQAQKKNAEALEIFKLNYKKFPNDPVTNLGLARGYSATGDFKNSKKYVESALALNPPPQVKATLEDAKKKLAEGKDFN